MKSASSIGLEEVKAVYDGPQGDLWELVMGQQIHVGGFRACIDLAERAGIGAGQRGVDLCCCNGADMRCLVRFRDVASMVGVDASVTVIERGRQRCEEEGLAGRIQFLHADACETGLPGEMADFVWSEDAWCYVADKGRLIGEAVRLARPSGIITFTDWVEGPAGLTESEAQRLFALMTFPNIEDVAGYKRLLSDAGCEVMVAEDTGRFAAYINLYVEMIDKQLTYDALRLLGFNQDLLDALEGEVRFMAELAQAGKVTQARFIARKR